MSAVLKLGSKLPGDPDTNGLDAIADDLVEKSELEPREDLTVIIAWIDVDHVTVDTDTGTKVPTVRMRRVEVLGAPEEVAATIRDAVQKAIHRRTGKPPIRFELAEVDEHDGQGTIDEAED